MNNSVITVRNSIITLAAFATIAAGVAFFSPSASAVIDTTTAYPFTVLVDQGVNANLTITGLSESLSPDWFVYRII